MPWKYPNVHSLNRPSLNFNQTGQTNFTIIDQLLLTAAIVWSTAGRSRSTKALFPNYDYIVVGGGTAGSVVASRLSENKAISVLLLEAGGSTSEESHIPAMYSPLTHRPTPLIRDIWSEPQAEVCHGDALRRCDLKVLNLIGGGASINSMIYKRGARLELDRWSRELGLKSWSYDALLRYYEFIERHMVSIENWSGSSDILVRYLQAGLELGFPIADYNAERETTFYPLHRTVKNGVRQSSDLFYIRPFEDRKNLDILMFAKVTKVLISNQRAIGVQFIRDGRSYEILADREVILSAGALVTPQLLMLSGIGPRLHLQKFNIPLVADLPVGNNLQDVLWCNVNFTTTLEFPDAHFDQKALDQWRETGTGIFTGSITGYGVGSTNNSINNNDPSALINLGYEAYTASNGKRYFEIIGVAFQAQAKSRGQVRLRSTYIYDDPSVDPRYLSEATDRDDAHQSILKLVQVMNTKPFREINAKPVVPPIPACTLFSPWSQAHVACLTKYICLPSYIFAGTARMGSKGDPTAVLDDQLKVRGVRGLRVVDNSASPSIEDANSMATAIVIAEKASELIRQGHHRL